MVMAKIQIITRRGTEQQGQALADVIQLRLGIPPTVSLVPSPGPHDQVRPHLAQRSS